MFYKYFRNKINDIEKVHDSYAILFSNDDKIRKQYNLSYLGEVFERHQDRNLNVEDILFAAVLGAESNQYFIDDSINTNQFQMFINRYSSEMETCYTATNHLAFIILLSLMDKNAEAEEELLSFINNNPLNEDFLLLIEGFKDNVFTLSDAVLKAIVNKLEHYKFDIDFEKLLNVVLNDYACSTVYINIRDITKILNLKSGMFKNKEVFKILNSYKKIGSNRIDKDDAQNMLKCFTESEDVFWLLNLQIANETLTSGGSAISVATYTFNSYIRETANIDRDNFEILARLKDVNFHKQDFSHFEESKYLKLIQLYNASKITAQNIGKHIFTSSSFIKQFKAAIDNEIILKHIFVKFYLDAISILDNMEDKVLCFNEIKSIDSELNPSAYITFIKAGLMDLEEAMTIVKESLISPAYNDPDIDDIKLSVSIINNVLDGNIKLLNIYNHTFSKYENNRYFRGSIDTCNFVSKTLMQYMEQDTCSFSNTEKIELIQKLERFLYITANGYYKINNNLYINFILYSFNNELYKTALELSDEEIRTISKTLLGFNKITNPDIIHMLNKFAYSEKEANLLKLQQHYEEVKKAMSRGYIYSDSNKIQNFLDKASELDVVDEYKQQLVEYTQSLINLCKTDFIDLLINLYQCNVLSKEQRNTLMCEKLDQLCSK